MDYQEYIKLNRIKLDCFCVDYFRDKYNSDKSKITEEVLINLLEYLSKTEDEYEQTKDIKKLYLTWKLSYLNDYLEELLQPQSMGKEVEEPGDDEKALDNDLDRCSEVVRQLHQEVKKHNFKKIA